MYDQVPDVVLDMSDPLWPVFAVPVASAALCFLWADCGQRIPLQDSEPADWLNGVCRVVLP